MINDAKHWDAVHKKTFEDSEWHSRYAEEKEREFPRGSIVLDLGGGTGSDAFLFLQKGHSVVLLDISEFALKVCQEKAKRNKLDDRLVVRQIDYGLHDLPLKDSSVDVVYSRIGLNYFPSDQTIKLFHSIYKILKAGGKAFLTFKSPDDENEMEYLRKTAVEYEPGVFIQNGQLRSRFSVDELKNMLLLAGIRDFRVTPYEEELSDVNAGHHPVLHVNEITFVK